MIRNQSGMWKPCIGVMIALSALASSVMCQDAKVAHIVQAETLVSNLDGVEDNHYGKGRRVIHWEAGDASARTVCSSFVTLLLERTYGWTDEDFKKWMGARNPDAADYHDAVVKEKGFTRIRAIADIAVETSLQSNTTTTARTQATSCSSMPPRSNKRRPIRSSRKPRSTR